MAQDTVVVAVQACAFCGKAFTPKVFWQKYHSPSCRAKAHKAKEVERMAREIVERMYPMPRKAEA